ncbi:MAG: SURF1 family cytochrome oxidase biogenesis protein, partial [Chloroflexota bacterium]
SQYRAPMPADGAEPVEVVGWIRPAQRGRGAVLPAQAALPDRLTATLDVSSLQTQVTHRLLPVVVVQLPEPGQSAGQGVPPYREAPTPELGDGVHVIAAIQWFAFSVIGAAGYLIYLARQAPVAQSIA